MNNKVQISNDAINIYVSLEIKSNKIGLSFVVFLILLCLTVLYIVASEMLKEDMREFIKSFFVLILMLVLFLYFPIRYLLWNLYGKEVVIVNGKSVSYYFSYGLLETNLKTNIYDCLELRFEKTRTYNDLEYGNLIFVNYKKENDLPEILHNTSVLIEFSKFLEIEQEFYDFFVKKNEEENIEILKSISLN